METLKRLQNKVLQGAELDRQLAIWRFQGKKLVFTNGCFDILHKGHVEYLSKASDLGHVMVIGLNDDASVHRLKGEGRPVNPQDARSLLLASLSFVDAVVLFSEDTPYNLINHIQPDILVKGADYKAEDVVGYDIVMAKGGEVMTIDLTQGYSTTGILEKSK